MMVIFKILGLIALSLVGANLLCAFGDKTDPKSSTFLAMWILLSGLSVGVYLTFLL